MRKYKLSQKQYDEVINQAREANAVLNGKGFSYLREYLDNALNSIEDVILNNSVKDVTECVTIGQTVKQFFTPRKIQIDELIGQRKFIKQFLSDMQTAIDNKDDLEKDIQLGRVNVEGVEDVK